MRYESLTRTREFLPFESLQADEPMAPSMTELQVEIKNYPNAFGTLAESAWSKGQTRGEGYPIAFRDADLENSISAAGYKILCKHSRPTGAGILCAQDDRVIAIQKLISHDAHWAVDITGYVLEQIKLERELF